MESAKDEGSPSSSGLAMVGSKEPLFHVYSQLLEREREERGGKVKEREVILVKHELLAWQLSLIGLF